MSALCFLLISPEHKIYKGLYGEIVETLVFDNRTVDKVRIGKGIGAIRISREGANPKAGNEFESCSEEVDVADKDFLNNSVTIHNLTTAQESKPKTSNQENHEEQWMDKIFIDRSLGLTVHLYLHSEQFSHLLQINWRERYLNLTMETKQSIHDMKFPLSEEYGRAVKEGRDDVTMEFDVREIDVKRPCIAIQELLYHPMAKDINSQHDQESGQFKLLFGK
jgi:hypothetical protein